MEQTIKKHKLSSLSQTFYRYVLITLFIIVSLSGITFITCDAVQNWLLPQNNECYLNIEETYSDGTIATSTHLMKISDSATDIPTELVVDSYGEAVKPVSTKYSVELILKSPEFLSPKKEFLFKFCQFAKVVVPFLFVLTGVLICGMYFYKKKLQVPIEMLSNAAKQISSKQLDFTISYDCDDELGELCSSFETMRYFLAENNKEMWRMVEDRRKLQASIAHDLRNPIAIVKGYAEYLKINIPLGKIDNVKILEIADKIEKVANRMDTYTESVRKINHLEELLPCKNAISTKDCIFSLTSDAEIMCKSKGITFCVDNQVPSETIFTDMHILSRIIENLISNSLRYAQKVITISFLEENNKFIIEIADDGCGFSKEVLAKGSNVIHSKVGADGHLGIGLYMCDIFCHKLDGKLKIYNNKNGGAVVKIVLPF